MEPEAFCTDEKKSLCFFMNKYFGLAGAKGFWPKNLGKGN